LELNFTPNTPARKFNAGSSAIAIYDCGEMFLAPNEQITFKRQSGAEYDLVAKDWGFYATPSINGRLSKFGLRTALVLNTNTKLRFILIVENGFEESFASYLKTESLVVEMWLDNKSETLLP
jgi:hypothetical protein